MSPPGQVDAAWIALGEIGKQLQVLAGLHTGQMAQAHAPVAAQFAGVPVASLINEFLRAKARAGRSDRYLRGLRNSLVKFSYGRAKRDITTITVQELESWLNGSGWKARTQKGYLGDVRTLFNFAAKRGYLTRNPAAAVELPAAPNLTPSLHTPAQVKKVLDFARTYDANICRCLAVRYFAGLRSSEADQMLETEIHSEHLEVTAAKSKTRRRRLITIEPCLSAWLALGGTLPVRGNKSNVWRDFNAAMVKATGVTWAHNVTRHSFVSYHLAHFQNAGKTALQAGHTEAILFANYRELVTKAAASEFWAITP